MSDDVSPSHWTWSVYPIGRPSDEGTQAIDYRLPPSWVVRLVLWGLL